MREILCSDCCNVPLEKGSHGENSDLNWCSKCGDRCKVVVFIKR